MGVYRLAFEERKRHTVQEEQKTGEQFGFEEVVTAVADEKVMAGTLRALADKIDPPKTTSSY